jgi:hypothetical protein
MTEPVEIIEECIVCFEPLSTQIFLPCNHKFCYLCIKTTLKFGNDKCPLCKCIVPKDYLENAKAKSGTDNFTRGEVRWMYSGRNGGWWYYDKIHSEEIEKNYQKIKNWDESEGPLPYIFKLTILSQSYTINLMTNTQTSDINHAVRHIKCEKNAQLDDTAKGIAGLSYCDNPPTYEKKYETVRDPNYFNPHYVSTYLHDTDDSSDDS